ncbi:hypothetical protein E7T06_09045 [Deinococcus sp. Arct2-2]|uniref:hypothetical protein n=1 Tax=Deinococcus sp. Arct2-2 TaxID=2568653 RepID=UPI0010A44A7D|nr:hypothetical protein [Deinococcus sp. Arct2-2]THF70043.1 hypothetical protein E7T06_09045 [Deinococcus sp. Arct2-2]
MIAVLILIVIFGGIALITYVDNTTKAQRRAWRLEEAAAKAGGALPAAAAKALAALPNAQASAPAPDAPETLMVRLPADARARAWALLCTVADAQKGTGNADTRTAYLLRQTRESYLPDTLRAYLGLTDGARRALEAQGQSPDTLLAEQIVLMEDGVREALRHDHAAADRLLTQGRFLRERFGSTEGGLSLGKVEGG